MRKSVFLGGSFALLALIVAGCAGPERKFGRGIANTTEIVRGSEFNRQLEQGGRFDGPDVGFATGSVRGVNRTLARTGLGVYEVITFPLPPYGPIWTNYLSPKPAYPDAYRPSKWAVPPFDTDHSIGFSGGDVAPWFPGSRFRVFDN